MKIKPFGEIDPRHLDEYYDGKVRFGDAFVELDLNFETTSIEETVLLHVRKYLADIEALVKNALEAISHDYDLDEKSEARFYLAHHLSEAFSEEEKLSIFGSLNVSKDVFLKSLVVRRIGLYPEKEESYAVIDIKLPDEFTDYLMAVTFDRHQKLSYISMES